MQGMDLLAVEYQYGASGVKMEGDCTAVAAADAYVTGAEYAAHGALEKWQLGNGLWEVAQFNDRLQMARKRIGQTSAAQACGVAADDELCLEWGYGSASANNGNVMEAKQWSRKTAGGHLNLQSTFTYDGRNRLSAFNETVLGGGASGGAWGQTNFYDRYGNRWATGTSQSDATPEQQSRIDAATNRVVSAKLGTGSGAITYDNAGFMLTSPHVPGTLSYDAEGRQVASGTSIYVYDGEGRRVRKTANGVTSWFWYGADGALVAEDTTEAQEAGRQYLHVDALGSTRLVTKADKSVAARMDYWPFGEEVAGTSLYGNRDLVSGYTSASTVKQRFTGKERDQESGFDYFGARYYAGVMGRWTSPDAPWADQDPEDPQRWNLYQYAFNSPLSNVDHDGRSVWSKAVKVGVKVLKTGDGAAAFADNLQDAATLLNPAASPFEKAGAAISLLSELAPVSVGDVKDAARIIGGAVDAGKQLLKKSDGAVDATKAVQTAGNAAKKVHGNTKGNQPTELYKKFDKDGNFQKWGVSKNAGTRYSKKKLAGGRVDVVDSGSRTDMLAKERDLVETDPGPQNREPWAGKRAGEPKK